MLAEPRRRQKWSINPRGNLWSKDESKFGQKLLEKMGWNSGDGLGAQKQGMTDPITLAANSDNKGLGHKGGDDDVWLTHKDNFDDVLAALNSEHNSCANSDAEDGGKKEKQSLVSTSKKAKKRVHYEKFTKGKDLSRYSDKDLSCILGTEKRKKRKIDDEEYKRKEAEEKEAAKKAEEESKSSDSKEPTKDSSGLMVIQGGSINDYFKMKMQKLQEKRAGCQNPDEPSKTSAEVNSEVANGDKEKSDAMSCGDDANSPKTKKKKKKSKDREQSEVADEVQKPSKKRKNEPEIEQAIDQEMPSKKQKKKKSKDRDNKEIVERHSPKKSKSNKVEESSSVSEIIASEKSEEPANKKKKKKQKVEVESLPIEDEKNESPEGKDRKKKCKARHQECSKSDRLEKKQKIVKEKLENFAGFNGASIDKIKGYTNK